MIVLSSEPEWKLRSWLPAGLGAEEVVFFPDACPGKSPLPTGTTVLLHRPDWRQFAVSDCGCGMRLLESDLRVDALTQKSWDAVAERLRRNKGGLGDLGGGNHFVDALVGHGGDRLSFLIHTGSRSESPRLDHLIGDPDAFDREFQRVVDWARANRAAVQSALEATFGKLRTTLDLAHNTVEPLPDGRVIIRKGAVRVNPGDLNVLPSHLNGDVALVRATARVSETLFSLSHGTGRAMPRGESKALAEGYDFSKLRTRVLMPGALDDASLRSEGPYAYRDLDPCLELLEPYVEVLGRFRVIGYLGHL